MDSALLKSALASLRVGDKERFWAKLAVELTVSARGAYSLEMKVAGKKLREVNELQHLIVGQLCKYVADDSDKYPDDVLIDILLEKARNGDVEDGLERAFRRALLE